MKLLHYLFINSCIVAIIISFKLHSISMRQVILLSHISDEENKAQQSNCHPQYCLASGTLDHMSPKSTEGISGTEKSYVFQRQRRKVHVSGMESKVVGLNQKMTTKGLWTRVSILSTLVLSVLGLEQDGLFLPYTWIAQESLDKRKRERIGNKADTVDWLWFLETKRRRKKEEIADSINKKRE